MIPQRRLRRLLPPFVIPFNPDGEELPQSIPTWGPPRRGSLEVRTGELEGFAPPPLQTRRPLPIPIAPPDGEPDDNEELQQQRLPRALARPMVQPIAIEPDAAPLYDPTANPVADLGTPPVMIRRNNKRRPLGAIGGDSDLQRDTELLEAQQDYKAPRSTKDLLLRAATGFFTGGIPGAIGNALDYSLNQDTRNADAVGYDMGQTEGRLMRNQQQQATVAAQRRQGLQDRLLEARVVDVETPSVVKPEGWEVELDTDNDGVPDTVEYQQRRFGSTRRQFPKPDREPAGFTLAPGGARYDAQGNVIVERPASPRAETGNRVQKLTAARSELQQAIADEQNAAVEKDRAYAILEQLKKSNALPDDINQAQQAAAAANTFYRTFGDKKRAIQRRIDENAESASSSSGKRWSVSKWATANRGKDVNAAKAEAKRKGWVIVE